MTLAELPDFTVPDSPAVALLPSAGGLRVRVARWPARDPGGPGTVCVMGGRAEFIEKYFEVVRELLDRGFGVVAFDWRGQGGSDRLLANPRKGHVDAFEDFHADLFAVRDEVLSGMPGPCFALAHSMGGAILLGALARRPDLFSRAVITAPMLQIAQVRRPRGARFLAASLDTLGFGGSFIPGGGETPVMTKPFAGNPLSRDAYRYERTGRLIAVKPELGLGDPTIGWVHAAFRAIAPMADPNYPLALQTPMLIVAGARDRVTVTPAAERFAARLRGGRALVLRQSEHEVLMETDEVRQQFWAAFDAFVPGSEGEALKGTAATLEPALEQMGSAA